MKLINLGFYDENKVKYKELLSQHANKLNSAEKLYLTHYLKKGVPYLVVPGLLVDLLDENKKICSQEICTDGVFAWSKDILFYLEKHNTFIEFELLKHAERNKWEIPPNIDLSKLKI